MTQGQFKRRLMLQDAVMQRLEIMEEAVKTIPEDFRQAHPGIPWKGMAGLGTSSFIPIFR